MEQSSTVTTAAKEEIMRRIHLSDAKKYRNRGETFRARIAAGKAAACARRLKKMGGAA